MDDAKVAELERKTEENESNSGRGIGPQTRKLQAGDENDERIKEVERGINVTGDVDNGGGEDQVGENLKAGLDFRLVPDRDQEQLDQSDGVPEQNDGD